MAAAAIFGKFRLTTITQSQLYIFIINNQNLAEREKPTSWKQNCLQISLIWKSKMAAALQDIFTKFGTPIDRGQLRLRLTSNFTLTKFKMAAAVILKIHFNGYNSVAIACIYTKFGSERKTGVLEAEIPSNFTSVQIQDGGPPPFWKHINRHNLNAL